MAKILAVVGTMSSVGKSLLTAVIAHHFAQAGLKVFPFKAQNMSLNAFATEEGEMAYAQVFQAWAAGRKPTVEMNPLLLKPMGNLTSEIIFLGQSEGKLSSAAFRRFKAHYKERVFEVFEKVLAENELVVVEGAGSLAELNLLKDDFVNYEIIKRYQIPYILVGDIDRGGIFAQIWGTYELVPDIKDYSLGFVVNKFRGAPGLFEEGVKILEERTQKPCLGVLPHLQESVFEEDSASLGAPKGRFLSEGKLRLAVVYYPHLSNYLDFDPFRSEEVELIYTAEKEELQKAHVIFLPGSKNTLASLEFLKRENLFQTIRQLANQKIIVGICGGFQLLGKVIRDDGVENQSPGEEALSLLPHETVFFPEKIATASRARIKLPFFAGEVPGFEIRYGRSFWAGEEINFLGDAHLWGTYLHGLFYHDDFRHAFLNFAREKFGLPPRPKTSFVGYLQKKLAAIAQEKAFKTFLNRLERLF